jgi:hypothetical protein
MSKLDHDVIQALEEPKKKSFMGILARFLTPQSPPFLVKVTKTQSSH